MILSQYMTSVKKDFSIFVEGFDNPSVTTGIEDRPDMIVSNQTKDHVYVNELTIGFESNITKNCRRKAIRYNELCRLLRLRFDKVKYSNLSAIGIVRMECANLYTFLTDDIGLDSSQINYLMKKLIGCCIRTTYYLFCTRNKQGKAPKLLYW